MSTEKDVADAYERGVRHGYAEGLRVGRAQNEALEKVNQFVAASEKELNDIHKKYFNRFLEESTAISLLKRLDPYLDCIICYASTLNEHEGNRLSVDVGDFLKKIAGEKK